MALNTRRAHTAEDMRLIARRRLPRVVFDAIDGGAGDETSIRENRGAFTRLALRPRALVDVSEIDLKTTVLGTPISMPIMLAPCSFARMCNSQAEPGVARAAGRAKTIYVVPGGSGAPPERVAAEATGPLWYQLYLKPDRTATAQLVDRVESAGYGVLCVTIDTPSKPFRDRDVRNGIDLPLRPSLQLALAGLSRPRWAFDFLFGGNDPETVVAASRAYDNFADAIMHIKSVTLDDVTWLRDRWRGQLVVKGVLRGEDVHPLVDVGVDGIVVSNHGGRNLDGVVATIDVLPEIVAAAGGRIEVLLDGGVRRGTDVLKALALGARACLIGRPYMYALAAGGEQAVDRLLLLLRNELHRAMSFAGIPSIEAIDATVVEQVAVPPS